MNKRTLHVRTVDDLLAFIPLALGFHPTSSLVITTFTSTGDQPHIRLDIDDDSHEDPAIAAQLAEILARRGVTSVALVTYTDTLPRAGDLADTLAGALTGRNITPVCVLGVTDDDQRYQRTHRTWIPLDSGSGSIDEHPFTLQAAFEGRVVHPDRDALRTLLTGPPDVLDRCSRLVADTADTLHDDLTPGSDWATIQATWIHDQVGDHLVTGQPFDDATCAKMTCLLGYHDLRDVAWQTISPANAAAHLDLWTDLCRRTPLTMRAPAATLVAYTAWLTGNGALAWVAVDEALAADSSYPLAHRLTDLLTSGEPPHKI